MRTRAERRHAADLAKAEALRKLKRVFRNDPHLLTEARVGRNAATHNTCDCWMCKLKEPSVDKFTAAKLYDPKLDEGE